MVKQLTNSNFSDILALVMQSSVLQLPKSEVELKIELAPDEVSADIEAAAKRISESTKIPGFRPGHASFELVKSRVGEMKIWEEAMETIIRRTYQEALREHNLITVGQPYFSVLNLAPGNPIVYKVTTAVLPKITKIADYKSLKVKKNVVAVSDEEVNSTIKQLSKMQTQEQEVTRGARAEDKVLVDISMYLDKVPLDGGVAKGHGIYLNEPYYIPGLNEKLIGIAPGETREFQLEFPKEHYQKNIAGKNVEFKVTANKVFELISKPIDDAFAQSLGQKTLSELQELIKKNMLAEAELKESQKQEIALLEMIVDKSTFEEIPDILLNYEIERMLHELENSVAGQGLEWNKYLLGVKKTVAQLKLDFSPRALRRVKTAIAIREVAMREGIEPDDAEVAREITRATNEHANDPEAQKVIRSEEYAEEARAISRNRKTLEFLKKQ